MIHFSASDNLGFYVKLGVDFHCCFFYELRIYTNYAPLTIIVHMSSTQTQCVKHIYVSVYVWGYIKGMVWDCEGLWKN